MCCAALGDAHRGMANDLADLALEPPHTGLARIEMDDCGQRGIVDLDQSGGHAIGLQLAPHQIAPRDSELFSPSCIPTG